MEKLRHLLNITMLEHLPGIYNMMTIFNMLVFGFVVSQPVFCIMAINSIQKSIGVSRKVNLKQAKRKLLNIYQSGCYAYLALTGLLFWVINDFSMIAFVIAASMVLLVISNRVYSTRQQHLPA